jgi:hypothetical protein
MMRVFAGTVVSPKIAQPFRGTIWPERPERFPRKPLRHSHFMPFQRWNARPLRQYLKLSLRERNVPCSLLGVGSGTIGAEFASSRRRKGSGKRAAGLPSSLASSLEFMPHARLGQHQPVLSLANSASFGVAPEHDNRCLVHPKALNRITISIGSNHLGPDVCPNSTHQGQSAALRPRTSRETQDVGETAIFPRLPMFFQIEGGGGKIQRLPLISTTPLPTRRRAENVVAVRWVGCDENRARINSAGRPWCCASCPRCGGGWARIHQRASGGRQ